MTEPVKRGLLMDQDTGALTSYKMTRLTPEHIPDLLAIQEQILQTGGFDLLWFYPFQEEELDEILQQSDNLVLGIYVESELVAFRVGCGSGSEFREVMEKLGEPYQKRPCFLLNGALVKPRYRGNSLQQMMSEYTIDWCRNCGKEVFVVTVHPDNAPSIKSLENIGFIKKTRALLYNKHYDRLILVKE